MPSFFQRCPGNAKRHCMWWLGHGGRCVGLELDAGQLVDQVFVDQVDVHVAKDATLKGLGNFFTFATGALAIWSSMYHAGYYGWQANAIWACSFLFAYWALLSLHRLDHPKVA